MEVEQELADVPGGIGHGSGIAVVEVEHLAVLGLERVGARRRGADDPVPRPRVAGQDRQVVTGPRSGGVVQAVADERQTATRLGRHDHLETVPFQDLKRRRRDMRLVVVRRAAVEVHDGPLGRRRTGRIGRAVVATQPPAEASRREPRQRRSPVDADDAVDDPAEEPVVQRPVGERRGQRPDAARQVGLSEEPVAQPRPVARPHLCPGSVVHLGDLHVGRTGRGTQPAARAVVDGSVGGVNRRPTSG